MAQSKAVGRKVAAPGGLRALRDRAGPPGVSPAAVLGPFRNFQAKLLSAWGRAVLEGRPPRDIAELVDAYARALPAEKAEVDSHLRVTDLRRDGRSQGAPASDRGRRAAPWPR